MLVSHRLPLTARLQAGEVRLDRSDGGLASGLRAVHAREGGLWIGWSGLSAGVSDAVRGVVARRLSEAGALSVELSEEEVAGHYRAYSNGVLWPALHGRRPAAEAGREWELYRAVNRRYAELVARHARPGDRVWVHDYHLMLLPGLLRERRPDLRLGFFLHTPFPRPETFAAIWEAPELLAGVAAADVIGFHTGGYARHFVSALELLGVGSDRREGGRARIVACPMGIDVGFFRTWARAPGVIARAARLRADRGGALLVGVDRLDYTKGIPERLRAFEALLALEPGLRGRVRLIQVAVPSREDARGYPETRRAVEALVERINGRFGGPGWTPVEYRYGRVDTPALVALYRAADAMLVTPVRDGLNLVAKEFVACREDGDGVLVLSRRAGAAAELSAAVLTDPRDPADLVRACRRALEMPPAERRVRMRRLRAAVQGHDVLRWSSRFLRALGGPQPARRGELCESS